MKVTPTEARIGEAIERARLHSPFLRLQLDKYSQVADALATGDVARAFAAAGAAGAEASDLAAALRHERSAWALALGIGDLAGALTLEQVVGHLSDLADRTLERAVASVMQSRTPEAEPRGFAVIALGKHGSRELNYSSDLDLIFLYDPAALPLRPREEPQQAAVRIGQAIVELVQARTAEGYAFRIDLRLRPSPEVTPIALPVEAAISHYESSALPWERAAFIRARAVAGDMALGRYFLETIHPFVWRRSLDFGAIAEIRSLTGMIRDHYAQGQTLGPGYDVKRGHGGIREVEFFAQALQLIHGGRESELRAPATLDALAALARAGRLPEDDAEILGGAYRLLRTIEHRLQMVDDRQTHSLPIDPAALDNVARLHGLADGPGLVALLEPHVSAVATRYDALDAAEDTEDRLPPGNEALAAWVAGAGFADAEAVVARIESWRGRKARSLRAPAAWEAFEAMLPRLLRGFVRSPDPMRAINRFDDVVERLPSGVNLYRLLAAQPALVDVLATVLAQAPALAEQLARRPELLDGLIDASAFAPPPAVPDLVAELCRLERQGEDYQQLLDRVRRRVNEHRFALGAQLIVGATDPVAVADGYARVADAAIEVLGRAAAVEFEQVHGTVAGSELLILGLGRLGSGTLTHASDLDLVYLFTGTHEAESDGRKPLRATDYFNRLAQRVTAALSVPTAAGALYEVDTRLRPSGSSGLLAVSVESFADYQRSRAWTWEHMALTRARPVFGSAARRGELQAVIDAVLRAERNSREVAAEAAKMRADIARHKPPAGPFDIKLGEGGLVDLEFAVHTLQLQHRLGLHPRMDEAIADLVAAGLLPPETLEAYLLLTRMLVTLRLVSPSSDEPPAETRDLVAHACQHGDWPALLAAHDEARQRVSALWRRIAANEEE